MTSVNQSKIENLSNNKGLKFHNAWIVTDNVTVNNISIANPNGDTTKNYSRNWGGFRRLITVNFLLFNDGTDKSTDTASKITLSSQRNYLTEPSGVIQGKSSASGTNVSDIVYRLTVYEDGITNTYSGSIEDISISSTPDESNMLRGSINMFESNPN